MVLTFIVESALAVYVWFRYRATAFGRLVVVTLLFLAAFQLAEYQICIGNADVFWARFGIVATTMLPAFGLHLLSMATGKRHFLMAGYFIAIAFVGYFILAPQAIDAVCGGNYIIFESASWVNWSYAFYYVGFLLISLWEALEKIFEIKKRLAGRRTIFYLFIAGYLSFMLPMSAALLVIPSTRSGITSIMCGFAVILALLLAFKIVPLYHKKHGRHSA